VHLLSLFPRALIVTLLIIVIYVAIEKYLSTLALSFPLKLSSFSSTFLLPNSLLDVTNSFFSSLISYFSLKMTQFFIYLLYYAMPLTLITLSMSVFIVSSSLGTLFSKLLTLVRLEDFEIF
jgi:hypothetical protein